MDHINKDEECYMFSVFLSPSPSRYSILEWQADHGELSKEGRSGWPGMLSEPFII